MPETSCMKVNSVHIKNMRIKQLYNHKVCDFAMSFRVTSAFDLPNAMRQCSTVDCFKSR